MQGVRNPPPPEMTCGFLIQLVFGQKKKKGFIGIEVEQETSAPLPKKNPGSAPGTYQNVKLLCLEFMLESAAEQHGLILRSTF